MKALVLLVCFLLTTNISRSQEYERPPAFAQKVYSDIFMAMNDNSIRPKLLLSKNTKDIAERIKNDHDNGQSIIVIGQGLIDICRSFGKDSMNALAHVLGHEMAHVFRHNNDITRVGSGYASEELKKELKNFNDSLNFNIIERQADEFASFYCHVAGYETGHIGANVLDSIYKRFNLSDAKLKRYPNLSERKEIVRSSEDKMKVLKLLYDDGNLALVSGNYIAAQKFFATIIDYNYKSREMWNNLGVAYLMDAIDELDTIKYPYFFPLQIDIRTNLERSLDRNLKDEVREKLEMALLYFGYSIKQSDEYGAGLMNKAITEFLLEDFGKMNRTLDIVEDMNDSDLTISVHNLRAIYFDKLGDKEMALKTLSKCIDSSELARRNYKLINDEVELSSFSKVEITNQELMNVTWPVPIYSKEQMSAGRKLIASLFDPTDIYLKVFMKLWLSEDFTCFQWDINESIFEVWKKNVGIVINEKNWNDYRNNCDRYFKFGNTEFIVFGTIILKKDLETILLFRIK
jgi:tetratricopeptide (TPR) repeat protein